MTNSVIKLVFHSANAIFSSIILYRTFTISTGKLRLEDLVQLTNINYVFTTLYYYLSIFRDVKEIKKTSKEAIKSPKTYLIFWTVFALSHLVSIGYWFLRLTNEQSVIPADEKHATGWFSYVTHGGNIILLYLELIWLGAQNFRESSFMWVYYSVFTISYIILQSIYNHFTGLHVYPFLKSWPVTHVAIFYFTLYIILIAAFEIGQKVKGDKKVKQKTI